MPASAAIGLAVALALLLPGGATGPARADANEECRSNDPLRLLKGCTELLNTKRYDDKSRSTLLTRRGFGLLRLRKTAEALADFDLAITANPSNASAHAGRATVLFRNEDYKRALESADRAIGAEASNLNALEIRARTLSALGRQDDAERDIDKAIGLSGSFWPGWRTRGIIARQRGNFDAAIEHFNEAHRLSPGTAELLMERGDTYLLKGLAGRALSDYDAALRLDAQNEMVVSRRRNLLVIYPNAGVEAPPGNPAPAPAPPSPPARPTSPATHVAPQPAPQPAAPARKEPERQPPTAPAAPQPKDGPTQIAEPATSSPQTIASGGFLPPGDPSIAIEPAVEGPIQAKLKAGEHKDALAMIDQALSKTPTNAALHRHRAIALLGMRESMPALQAAQRAVELQPRYFAGHSALIDVHMRMGNDRDAMAVADRLTVSFPDSPLSFNVRGRVNLSAGRQREAAADFDRAIGKDARFAVGWFNRGLARHNMGETETAVADFTEYIRLDPKDDDGYAFRGRSLLARGDQSGALADYRKALSIRSTNWTAASGMQTLQVVKAMQQLGQLPKP